jgi:hypothetical protein
LRDVARLQVRVRGGEVGASGDGDGAEPVLIVAGAVVAGAGERVLGVGGGVAGDLLEGVREVLEEGGGVGVVERGERGDGGEECRVGGDRVGDFGAEG